MREILVYDDYEIHKLGISSGTQYEEITTEKATRIDVTDVAKRKGKLIPFGMTGQTQLSGKNNFNKLIEATDSGLELINNSDNTFTLNGTSSGSGYAYFRFKEPVILKAGNYTMLNIANKVRSSGYLNFGLFSVNDSGNIISVALADVAYSSAPINDVKAFTLSEDTKIGGFRTWFNKDETADEINIKCMIVSGTYTIDNIPDYEPYCGGQPSPNPDYSQPIENVEGKVGKNLFNEQEVQFIVGILNDNGQPTGATTSKYTEQYYAVKGNTSYVLSGTITAQGNGTRIYYYDENKNWISRSGNDSNSPRVFTTPQNCAYIRIQVTASISLKTGNVMLEEGSTATEYEPYKKAIEIKVHNINLAWQGWAEDCVRRINNGTEARIEEFDDKHCLRFVPSTGYGDYDNKYIFKTKFKENTRYTFVFDLYSTAGNNNLSIHYTDGTTTPVAGIASNTWTKVRFISAVDKTVKYITSAYYAGAKYLDLDTFMVLEGVYTTENLPEYVESKEQTVVFPLNGQKLMEGDYLADDGVHHVRGQIVLDGSQLTSEFNYNSALSTADYNCFFFANDSIKQASNNTDVFVIADKLLGTPASQRTSNKLNCWINHLVAHLLGMHVPNTITDTTQLKTWLTNNPITFEYVLEEETIEPYTLEQAEAYNQLKKLLLYKGVNHICTETDGLEPNLQLTYTRKKQNNVLQVNNIQPLNLEINNINDTVNETTDEPTVEENEELI